MMTRFLLLLLLFFSLPVFSQDDLSLNTVQDTINLKDVLIEKGLKKPKLKKIKIGDKHHAFSSSPLSFAQYPVFFLTDSLPEGIIESLSLGFEPTTLKYSEANRFFKKAFETEFEITLYEVGDDYSVGNKVNNEPIIVKVEESKTYGLKKVNLDLTSYNFKANRFYITVKKTTPITCDECYYFAPELYQTTSGNHFIAEKINKVYAKSEPYCYNCLGLRMQVKTLTKDY